MRGDVKSNNYQFGPVNTYHMEGSIRTRLGFPGVPAQDPTAWVNNVTGNVSGYEWSGYSFRNFTDDWKPEDFEY